MLRTSTALTMKRWKECLLAIALLVLGNAGSAAPLELVQTIPLGVSGRIDHLSVDPEGKRLYVAALGNHSLEVVNLANGAVRSVGGLGRPQGVVYVPGLDRLFVADGDKDFVAMFDAQTLAAIRRSDGLPDADNVHYEAVAERVYVGYGDGGVRAFDAKSGARVAEAKLPGHPEGFAVARGGKRLFANVPDAGVIAVVDFETNEVTGKWPTGDVKANFPLVLNEADHRVYVGTRRPARLLVFDSDSGRRVAALPINGDIDDLFFDSKRGRLYAICGEGFVDVVRQSDPDHFSTEARVDTRSGARTGLFVPALQRLYVAVPRRSRAAAEIRVYAVDSKSLQR